MPRLQRCTAITTGSESSPRTNNETSESGFQSCRRNARAGAKEEEEDDLEAEEERLDDLLPKTIKRSKPFKYVYEKEIVMYAYFKKLDYHSTECIYAPTAYRGYARALVKDLEAVRPSAIVDLIYSGEAMAASLSLRGRRAGGEPDPILQAQDRLRRGVKDGRKGAAKREGSDGACMLLEGLNRGVAKVDLQAA
ncbi:cytosolic thiouridylase subunit Ctu1 [Rhodotorula sphaerocarpa]